VNSDFWSDVVDWIADTIAYQGANPTGRPLPKIEAKDGQEPTAEFQRQLAREADARTKSQPAKTLASVDKKTLDREFWETM
jgi:hypothetical protein